MHFSALGWPTFFLQRITDPRPPFDAVTSQHPEIGVAFTTIVIAGEIALLAVLLGGVPIAWSVIRSAIATKQSILRLFGIRPRYLLALFGGCLIIAIGYFAYSGLTQSIGNQPTPIWAPLYFLVGILFFGGLLFVVLLPTTLISVAVARSTIGKGVLRFMLIPASIVTAAMAVALVATSYWGARIWLDTPQFFNSGDGLAGGGPLFIVLGMMLVATGVATRALWQGFTARDARGMATAAGNARLPYRHLARSQCDLRCRRHHGSGQGGCGRAKQRTGSQPAAGPLCLGTRSGAVGDGSSLHRCRLNGGNTHGRYCFGWRSSTLGRGCF